MHQLVATIEAVGPAVNTHQILVGDIHSFELFGIFGALVVDHGLFPTLSQVHAVNVEEAVEHTTLGERTGPVGSLFCNQVAEFEQPALAGEAIEPIYNVEVVATTLSTPIGPVAQGSLGQLLQLILEVFEHKGNHTLVAGSIVVLFEHFEHHHFGPPVVRVVALQAILIGAVGVGTEVTILFLAGQSPLNPGLNFVDKSLIAQNVSQRKQTVDPVGTTLPHVAIATEPTVAGAHNLGIESVEVAGHTVGHDVQLLFEPTLGLYCTNGQLHVGLGQQGRTVVQIKTISLLCIGCAKGNKRKCKKGNKFFKHNV